MHVANSQCARPFSSVLALVRISVARIALVNSFALRRIPTRRQHDGRILVNSGACVGSRILVRCAALPVWRWAAGESNKMLLFAGTSSYGLNRCARRIQASRIELLARRAPWTRCRPVSPRRRGRAGSAAPEIGFHSAHHVMPRADGCDVSSEIDSVAHAGSVNSREAFFDEAFGLQSCRGKRVRWRCGASR